MTQPLPAHAPTRRPVVLLTGASSGIGEQAARALAAQGYALVLTARRGDRLAALARELDPGGQRVQAVAGDVADAASRAHLAQTAISHFGRIDVLINNAGISVASGHWWDDPDPLRVLQVNLEAPVALTRLVLPAMLARGSGHIVNIGSVAGRVATHGVYSASKFGLRGFSLALRRELAGSGVHVSLISPGFIRTPLTAGARLPMPGPAVVSRALLAVLERPVRERVVPRPYLLAAALDTLAPGLVDRLIGPLLGRRYPR
jgi:short-subunit dehydrogenase